MYVSDFNGTLVAVTQLKMDKSADVDHMNEIKALRFAYYYAFHFMLSICICSVLCHPNIVLFMGYTHQDNCIPIITNFVEGNDLFHLLFK